MSEVKLPEINQRGQSRGAEKSERLNGGPSVKRSGSFASMGPTKSVFAAKKDRKDIERDAQLLANRIALLKQEELKTWKKIEETKKRAGDVQRLKHKNEERQQKKLQFEIAEQQRQEQHRQNIQMMKQQRNIESKKIKDAIMLHKKEEAKQGKFIAEQHKNQYRKHNQHMVQEKMMKNQIQKQQEKIQRAKVDEYRRQKHEAAREEIARKIAEEEDVIRQKEAEVMQMEMLEMELIKKLQNTQAIQKQAYSELEAAINLPVRQDQIYDQGKFIGGGSYNGQSNGQLQNMNAAMGNMNLGDQQNDGQQM